MKLLLSHIADMDGISPVILLKLLDLEFDYALFEVGEVNDYLNAKLNDGSLDKYDEIRFNQIKEMSDIHKLNHRLATEDKESNYYYILNTWSENNEKN